MRSIEELEKRLRKIISNHIKEKVSDLPKEKGHISIPLDAKQIPLIHLKKLSKKLSLSHKKLSPLTNDMLCSKLLSGKKPVHIAREYGISKSAVTQRLKRLEAKNLVGKTGKGWKVKQIVKDLALSTTESKKIYEFQTIQIIIPLKNPGQLDLLKWDQYEPVMRQWYKKYPQLKFTLNRTTRSIRLFLKSRWIEKPEQIRQLCINYINLVAEKLKEFDIELLKEEARTTGLHLWKGDKIIEKEYRKEDGFIGVHHGIDADKILPEDKEAERKTWCDSTPSPDGIESNDVGYFRDKDSMEFFVGVPKGKLEEYMITPTDFISTMKDFITVTKEGTAATRLEIYNKQLHQSILEDMSDTLKKIDHGLMARSSILKLEQPDYEPRIVPGVKNEYVCPRCKSKLSPKAIVKRNFLCPNCYKKLGLEFPEILQNKDKFL